MTLLQRLRNYKFLAGISLCMLAVNSFQVKQTYGMATVIVYEELIERALEQMERLASLIIAANLTQTQQLNRKQAKSIVHAQANPVASDTYTDYSASFKTLIEPKKKQSFLIHRELLPPTFLKEEQLLPSHTITPSIELSSNKTITVSNIPTAIPYVKAITLTEESSCSTQSETIAPAYTQTIASQATVSVQSRTHEIQKTATDSFIGTASIAAPASIGLPTNSYAPPMLSSTISKVAFIKLGLALGVYASVLAVAQKICDIANESYDYHEKLMTYDRKLYRDPQRIADYYKSLNHHMNNIYSVSNSSIPIAQRYYTALIINQQNLEGLWGDRLNNLVRQLNSVYFDTKGNLKSSITNSKEYAKFKKILLNFFKSYASSPQQLEKFINAARKEHINLATSHNFQELLRNFKPKEDNGPSILRSWWDKWAKPQQATVINNSQNQAYLELRQLCSLDPALANDVIRRNLAQAQTIIRDQLDKYPDSLVSNIMKQDWCELLKNLPKLATCANPTILSINSTPTPTQGICGLPASKEPTLPANSCGTSSKNELLVSIDTCIPQSDVSIPTSECNYSKARNIPTLESKPQILDSIPQPTPYSICILPEKTSDTLADIKDIIPANSIISQPDTIQKEKKKKSKGHTSTYEQQIESIQKALREQVTELEEQLRTELALADSVTEKLSIETRIQQALEVCRARAEKNIAKIRIAQAESLTLKLQKALEKQRLIEGLTLDNLPEVASLNFDETIGDIELVRALIEEFKTYPGALNTDGPVTRIIKLGLKGSDIGKLNRAKGAILELLTARKYKHELIIALDKIHEITEEHNKKLGSDMAGKKVEFDIETEKMLIEVKGGQWKEFESLEGKYDLDFIVSLTDEQLTNFIIKLGKTNPHVKAIESVYDTLKNFLEQKAVAKIINKDFILVYFNELPHALKSWLEKEYINFTNYQEL